MDVCVCDRCECVRVGGLGACTVVEEICMCLYECVSV